MEKLAILGGEPVRRKPFAQFPVFDERELSALKEVLESGVWGGYNPKVAEFEQAFAEFHQARFGITAANGTVTLETALAAAGIGAGCEVIVPPISFIATATAVLRIGATPVFADIDEATYNLNPSRVEEVITKRTRAIIPVHFAGQPADMDALMSIAERHQLIVIEDCAHAHGASWKGKSIGSFGHFGSFSFQASKNLTAGEGGLLTSNDEELAEIARSICNQGRRTGGGWYEHVRLGTNYRLTGWQAAILLSQFSRLPEQIERRNENARFLNEQLSGMDLISTPYVDERVTSHSYYLYMIRLNPEQFPGTTKDNFVKALAAEGIPCSAGYPHPLYKNQVFNDYKHIRNDCPEAERMCSNSFWLSHEIMLSQPDSLNDVTFAIEKVVGGIGDLAKAI
ncbi:MAG: DegT/DnrJ/EryC1/StrS family aminotransferase [Acidobacteria bacterium]|jgi:dTDP-4-amino-4,6-dideoxygalactose transaminase|nr:DegT/DnrJ/EryC1/StrS family aminotransferase [Acidobacteriota bacterium]